METKKMQHRNFLKRELFGFVYRFVGLIPPAFYSSIENDTNFRNISEKNACTHVNF